MVTEGFKASLNVANHERGLGQNPGQRYTEMMKLLHMCILVGLITGLMSFSVQAQWQWLDLGGRRVYSDMPPGPDIPEANILRRPGQTARPGDARAIDADAPAAEPPPLAPKVNDKDRELLARKKQAEDAQQAQRKAQELNLARQRADNCARARQAKAALESGTRMARINEKGEREYFDDAMRANESQRIQGIIESDCY